MRQARAEVVSAIARARADLDRALARLELLADDDRQRVSYSVHALSNYLMVVATTVQLLQNRLAPNGERDVRRLLDSLKQATNLMMNTARGVLTATPDSLPPLLFEHASLTPSRQTARGRRPVRAKARVGHSERDREAA
jgi:hypothetical protein